MVRLEKVVYRDHIIKEKELNLERETKQLRGQPVPLAFSVSAAS